MHWWLYLSIFIRFHDFFLKLFLNSFNVTNSPLYLTYSLRSFGFLYIHLVLPIISFFLCVFFPPVCLGFLEADCVGFLEEDCLGFLEADCLGFLNFSYKYYTKFFDFYH